MASQPYTSSTQAHTSSASPTSETVDTRALEATSSTASANTCADVPGGFFGARFSLYPMTDRFVPVILHSIEGLRETGLEVETDDVSTFLGGPQPIVFGALHRAFARAASTGEHVVMTVIFSYG